jgi:hypothetical protein
LLSFPHFITFILLLAHVFYFVFPFFTSYICFFLPLIVLICSFHFVFLLILLRTPTDFFSGSPPFCCLIVVYTHSSYSAVQLIRGLYRCHLVNPEGCISVRNFIMYVIFIFLLKSFSMATVFTPWSRTFFEKSIDTQLVKQYPAFFMESEGSLPCSQKLAIRLYPQPVESNSPHRSLCP